MMITGGGVKLFKSYTALGTYEENKITPHVRLYKTRLLTVYWICHLKVSRSFHYVRICHNVEVHTGGLLLLLITFVCVYHREREKFEKK